MGLLRRWLAPGMGSLYVVACLVAWHILLHRHLATSSNDPAAEENTCLHNVLASFKLGRRRTTAEEEINVAGDEADEDVTVDSPAALYAKYAAIQKSHLTIQSRKIRGACRHKPKDATPYSSVEFTACCGLGHRLARMSAAAHVAQRLQAGLHSFWKCCDSINVFDHLFGEEPFLLQNHDATNPIENPLNVTKGNDESIYHIQFRNRIPGYYQISRRARANACPCTESKIKGDHLFYKQLMDRYRYRDRVHAFVKQYFDGKTSIGLHIRGGNGEAGDFKEKKRDIENEEAFVESMSNHVRKLVTGFDSPPILFIATDTPTFVDAFREELHEMQVVDMPQIRQSEGQGVLFGGPGDVTQNGEECMLGWEGAIEDMMILSSTDVVVATRPSSFVQTIPLSVVLGRQVERKVQAAYCEVAKTDIACYESVLEWCCKGRSGKAYEDTFFDEISDWTPGN